MDSARAFWGRIGRVGIACCVLAACSNGSSQMSVPAVGLRERSVRAAPALGVEPSPRVIAGDVVPRGGGVYKVGNPYRIGSIWYVPREEPGYDRSGTASWYGAEGHGRLTANGEVYDRTALTAAHPTLPLPSYAYVTNLANNRTILVRVNDRGPYAQNRLIDLSQIAARALGFEASGTGTVRVQYAGRAPLDGDPSREQAFLAQQPWSASRVADRAPATPPVAAAVPPRWQAAGSPPEAAPVPADNGAWSAADYRRNRGLAADGRPGTNGARSGLGF